MLYAQLWPVILHAVGQFRTDQMITALLPE